jgi:diphthine-ammonia ligase
MKQAFVSWSGGKDCCLACYRASSLGLNVRYLLNMLSEDGRISRSHGLPARWIQTQAEAMEIPLVQQKTTDDTYANEFKNALSNLRQMGITDGIFGDIDYESHRQWNNEVCAESGIIPHLPLWQEDQDKLVREFIDAGFEAVVVTTKADLLGDEWLGRKLDYDFLADLSKLENVTPCGEAGEFHTLVVDGPLFKKRIEIGETKKIFKDGYRFLDIKKAELKSK